MGILNVTPDSFYDGGRYQQVDAAIQHALKMIQEGADIIDIGGESTRPGATPLSASEECDRVIPIIEALRKISDIPLSIDSRHTAVIEAALAAGANIVNSIDALADAAQCALVARFQVPVCLMHMQGTPSNMQQAPHYKDVLQEVYDFFRWRIAICEKAGILRENIWIDPGFGFGKTLAHNLHLLANLSFFKTLHCPILVGLSRKSLWGEILNAPPQERLYGSLTGATLAALQGAAIIRTHDVAATQDMRAVINAVRRIDTHVCAS